MGCIECPATVQHVSACVAYVASTTASASSAEKVAASISFEHRRRFEISPTSHPSFTLLMKSIRKNYSSPRQPKSPITKEMIRQFLDHLYGDPHGRDGQLAPLPLWRTVFRVCLEFYTLGCFSDIAGLTTDSLRFVSDPTPHLIVHFCGGKNDLYSEGSERLIASNPEEPFYCPIRLARLYLYRLGPSYSGFLIPRCLGGYSPTVPDPRRRLSYTTALEDLRQLLCQLGYDPTSFGEHSGKRGGATAAAASGLNTAQLQRLGGWRSSQMPAKYTDLSTQTRIKLASSLL